MADEAQKKPGRPKTGLVDRLFDSPDDGGSDTDAEIYKKYVTDRPPHDPYAEEVGPGAGISKGIDSWLGEHVAEPLGRAGYPRVV